MSFPSITLSPAETVVGRRDAWEKFVERASAARLQFALKGLEALADTYVAGFGQGEGNV